MATTKNDKATQQDSAQATDDAQNNVVTATQDPSKGTHVAVNTIQYFDEKTRQVVEVKAGRTFTPQENDIEGLTRAGAIRKASKEDRERNTASQQDGGEPAPAGYAANTHTGANVYPGGVTNPNDIPANAGDNTSAEPSMSTDEAAARAPATSRTTTR